MGTEGKVRGGWIQTGKRVEEARQKEGGVATARKFESSWLFIGGEQHSELEQWWEVYLASSVVSVVWGGVGGSTSTAFHQ